MPLAAGRLGPAAALGLLLGAAARPSAAQELGPALLADDECAAGEASCSVKLLQHRSSRAGNGTGSLEELIAAAAESAVHAGMEALSDAVQLQAQNASAAAAGLPDVASAVAAAATHAATETLVNQELAALSVEAARRTPEDDGSAGSGPSDAVAAAAASAWQAAEEAIQHAEEDNATLPDTLAAAAAAWVHAFVEALSPQDGPALVASSSRAAVRLGDARRTAEDDGSPASGISDALAGAAVSAWQAAEEAYQHAKESNATLPDPLAAAVADAVHAFVDELSLQDWTALVAWINGVAVGLGAAQRTLQGDGSPASDLSDVEAAATSAAQAAVEALQHAEEGNVTLPDTLAAAAAAAVHSLMDALPLQNGPALVHLGSGASASVRNGSGAQA